MKTCWQREWKCFSWGVDEANIGTEFRVELQAPMVIVYIGLVFS